MCQPLILLLDDDGGSGEEGMNHRALSGSPCSQCLSWARQNACLLLVTLEQPVGMSIATLLFIVQLLNHVQLFAVTWTAACQVSISFTISWSLLKPMCTESVVPSNHLILCLPLLLLPSVFPSVRLLSAVLFALLSFWKLSVKQCLLQSTVYYLGVTSEGEYVLKSHHVPKAFLIQEGPFWVL